MATIKIRWTVNELANVMTQYDVQKIYRATSKTGTYAEITDAGTRVALVVDQTDYYYDDTAGASTYWYKISYFNSSTEAESSLSVPIPATGGGNYITVQDARDAGFSASVYTDAQVLSAIYLAESFLENVTGQWFYPRELTLRVDGNDSHILPIQHPIIQVDTVTVISVWAEQGSVYGDVSLDNLRVANRHLTEGLRDPDDRYAPSLTFVVYEHYPPGQQRRVSRWYGGTHNVKIEGWFGFTELAFGDPIGETVEGNQIPQSKGSTPPLIERACLLLLPRFIAQVGDPDELEDASRAWQVEKYKTRDQEIVYSKNLMERGAITGDPEVDRYLSMFTRPIEVAFV